MVNIPGDWCMLGYLLVKRLAAYFKVHMNYSPQPDREICMTG